MLANVVAVIRCEDYIGIFKLTAAFESSNEVFYQIIYTLEGAQALAVVVIFVVDYGLILEGGEF